RHREATPARPAGAHHVPGGEIPHRHVCGQLAPPDQVDDLGGYLGVGYPPHVPPLAVPRSGTVLHTVPGTVPAGAGGTRFLVPRSLSLAVGDSAEPVPRSPLPLLGDRFPAPRPPLPLLRAPLPVPQQRLPAP